MRKYNSECMGFHVNIENKTLFYHISENPNIFRTFVEIKNSYIYSFLLLLLRVTGIFI